MNNVSLSGYLTHDPELIYRNDRPFCTMRLMVKNGDHDPTYIDVRTFDDQAYVCAEYMRKGRKIAVTGRLIHEEWRGADEKKRERYSVIGWVEFLDRPSRDEAGQGTPDPDPEPQAEPELALAV
jgi:single-strand DNA-binding protein